MKKTTLILSACAAAVLMLVKPRAAHAVAAALVQVVNTAASPVIAEDVAHLASQRIHLECSAVNNGAYYACTSNALIYTVRAGQSLVIDAADVLP
jgi:hypothetical protein